MINHSRDFRRVKRLCDFPINIDPKCYYLIETVNRVDLGVWFFYPFEGSLIVHVNMSKECRGGLAKRSGEDAFDWIWNNTDYSVIYASIPNDRKDVQLLACAIGFDFLFHDETESRCYKIDRPLRQKAAG